MLASRWFALAGVALVFLAMWLYVFPDRRVYASAGLSGALFGMATLTAPGVERMASDGTVVAAPVGPTIQFVTGILAVLSLFVVYARRMGKWPPENDPEVSNT